MPSDAHGVLDLAFTKFDSYQTLWSLYITVVLGFLAYLAAAPHSTRSPLVRGILAFGFLLFACANLNGLLAVRHAREHLHAAAVRIVEKQQETDEETKGHLRSVAEQHPPARSTLLAVHVTADVVMILTILLLPGVLTRPVADGPVAPANAAPSPAASAAPASISPPSGEPTRP
jgi:hypothetical protein